MELVLVQLGWEWLLLLLLMMMMSMMVVVVVLVLLLEVATLMAGRLEYKWMRLILVLLLRKS